MEKLKDGLFWGGVSLFAVAIWLLATATINPLLSSTTPEDTRNFLNFAASATFTSFMCFRVIVALETPSQRYVWLGYMLYAVGTAIFLMTALQAEWQGFSLHKLDQRELDQLEFYSPTQFGAVLVFISAAKRYPTPQPRPRAYRIIAKATQALALILLAGTTVNFVPAFVLGSEYSRVGINLMTVVMGSCFISFLNYDLAERRFSTVPGWLAWLITLYAEAVFCIYLVCRPLGARGLALDNTDLGVIFSAKVGCFVACVLFQWSMLGETKISRVGAPIEKMGIAIGSFAIGFFIWGSARMWGELYAETSMSAETINILVISNTLCFFAYMFSYIPRDAVPRTVRRWSERRSASFSPHQREPSGAH